MKRLLSSVLRRNEFSPAVRNHRTVSSIQLSEDSISCFKNRNLAVLVNKLVAGSKATSVLNFHDSAEKQRTLTDLISRYNLSASNISSLKEMQNDSVDDSDFHKLAYEEQTIQEKLLEDLEENLLNELLSSEDDCVTDLMFEASAGVGGQEAMIFAHQLHDLYLNYSSFRGWECELVNFEETEMGGIRQSMLMISGKNSFKALSVEAGVHRVQRIPITEKYSRMHTSTVTITVYPQPSAVELVISDKDLKIETKTARGPGGQHVNKIETAVRIHHLPSGIIVDCQTHRSQEQNKKIAMQKLRSKLIQIECDKQDTKVENIRKFQMGRRGRNEKIRTINFTQDRITDHRFHISSHNIERYLEGGSHFHKFIEQLNQAQTQRKKEELLRAIENIKS